MNEMVKSNNKVKTSKLYRMPSTIELIYGKWRYSSTRDETSSNKDMNNFQWKPTEPNDWISDVIICM
jgi:hypothetical protein